MKKAHPDARVEVYERNRPDDTFGWGVVFSDKTMEGFRDVDPESHDAIVADFHHWDARFITVRLDAKYRLIVPKMTF